MINVMFVLEMFLQPVAVEFNITFRPGRSVQGCIHGFFGVCDLTAYLFQNPLLPNSRPEPFPICLSLDTVLHLSDFVIR